MTQHRSTDDQRCQSADDVRPTPPLRVNAAHLSSAAAAVTRPAVGGVPCGFLPYEGLLEEGCCRSRNAECRLSLSMRPRFQVSFPVLSEGTALLVQFDAEQLGSVVQLLPCAPAENEPVRVTQLL